MIGASFIGLEAAASLRARGCDVTVVGPEAVPLARVLGDEVGAFVRRIHEAKGVDVPARPQAGADHRRRASRSTTAACSPPSSS